VTCEGDEGPSAAFVELKVVDSLVAIVDVIIAPTVGLQATQVL